MTITKNEIVENGFITFESDEHVMEISHQDSARNNWANGFWISWNGRNIKSWKTFAPFAKEVEKRVSDFNLERVSDV